MHQVSGQQAIPTYMTTSGVIGSTQPAQPDNTALEAHLSFLRNLQDQAGGAASRAGRMADRLLGPEPAMLNKAEGGGLKGAAEPPLVHQLEEAARLVAQLIEATHQHLSRLERV